ncbi:MAG: methionyl-tRNA formyltransferase [Cyanobacteria bacterium P01_F01_bin.4]
MKLVFFGTPQFAVPSLERLVTHPDFDMIAIVSQPDRRRGRGGKVTPSPVKAAGLTVGCPIWQPERIKRDPETLRQLDQLQADAFVVVAYGQILSSEILAMPRLGCVNAHGSILPQYRGAAPIQWSLYHGEIETGVTTMQMDAGMDTGPMLIEATLPIGILDNARDIAKQLSSLSADLLVDTLLKLDAQLIRPVPQPDDQASYAPLIKKADYLIDWQRSALEIHNQVRGFYPSCFTQCRQQPLKVQATLPLIESVWAQLPPEWTSLKTAYVQLSSELSDAGADPSAPGAVLGVLKNYGPVVATGGGHLLLRTVQPAGKKAQSGWDFANGSRLAVGETLGGVG